jgi:thiamine pyrophosphate-dependent acetolactate synthase large subunit-like protein
MTTTHLEPPAHMSLAEALAVLREVRGNRVVISSMGTARDWPKFSHHPLDFHYVPSAMGGAVPLGLGIALARPDKEIVVLSGDGSLLMNLGSLATVAASGATNFTIVVIDNGVYEVTGGQPTPGAKAPVDFTMVAQGCGIGYVFEYSREREWRDNAAAALAAPGPRLIVLKTLPVRENYKVTPPSPVAQRVEALKKALTPVS